LYTIQGVLTQSEGTVSETMVRWAEGLGREAIVLVEGKVQMPPPDQGEVKTTTVHQRELKIEKVRSYWCICSFAYKFDFSCTSSPTPQHRYPSKSKISANPISSTRRLANNLDILIHVLME
jgi:hypothetical protein